MVRRNRFIAFTLSLLLMGSTSAWAEPSSNQLKQQRDQLQQNKNLLEDAQDELEELEAQVQDYDVQIEELMDSIAENKKQISKTEKDIDKTVIEVKNMEEKVEAEKILMGKRIRAVYKNGTGQYLTMLIGAKDFGDFISRLEWIKKIMDYDKQMIKSLEEKKAELNNKKEELNKKKEELVQLEKSNEQKLATIKNSAEEQKKLIVGLKERERALASKVTESQRLVDASLVQIQQIRRAAPKYVPSRGAAQISDNSIIAYASNFLGTPYVWGGTSPDPGFDCSGFTQYVYRHFGVRVGRTTKDQIHDGVAVSKSELQIGDLVFFGKRGVPNHMGIYAGNNTYIHAPQTGDVVKVSPMTRRDFITGRRVK
jgi:peptidoglycan DL-endopeptidase CwlO